MILFDNTYILIFIILLIFVIILSINTKSHTIEGLVFSGDGNISNLVDLTGSLMTDGNYTLTTPTDSTHYTEAIESFKDHLRRHKILFANRFTILDDEFKLQEAELEKMHRQSRKYFNYVQTVGARNVWDNIMTQINNLSRTMANPDSSDNTAFLQILTEVAGSFNDYAQDPNFTVTNDLVEDDFRQYYTNIGNSINNFMTTYTQAQMSAMTNYNATNVSTWGNLNTMTASDYETVDTGGIYDSYMSDHINSINNYSTDTQETITISDSLKARQQAFFETIKADIMALQNTYQTIKNSISTAENSITLLNIDNAALTKDIRNRQNIKIIMTLVMNNMIAFQAGGDVVNDINYNDFVDQLVSGSHPDPIVPYINEYNSVSFTQYQTFLAPSSYTNINSIPINNMMSLNKLRMSTLSSSANFAAFLQHYDNFRYIDNNIDTVATQIIVARTADFNTFINAFINISGVHPLKLEDINYDTYILSLSDYQNIFDAMDTLPSMSLNTQFTLYLNSIDKTDTASQKNWCDTFKTTTYPAFTVSDVNYCSVNTNVSEIRVSDDIIGHILDKIETIIKKQSVADQLIIARATLDNLHTTYDTKMVDLNTNTNTFITNVNTGVSKNTTFQTNLDTYNQSSFKDENCATIDGDETTKASCYAIQNLNTDYRTDGSPHFDQSLLTNVTNVSTALNGLQFKADDTVNQNTIDANIDLVNTAAGNLQTSSNAWNAGV